MRFVLAMSFISLVACKPQAGGYSCWTGNVCEDYTADIPTHEASCKSLSGEWEKHPCPSENLIGTCMTAQHQARMYYGGSTNAYTSDSASANCEHELHGSWSAAK